MYFYKMFNATLQVGSNMRFLKIILWKFSLFIMRMLFQFLQVLSRTVTWYLLEEETFLVSNLPDRDIISP